MNPDCPICRGTGWVCEEHDDQPFGLDGYPCLVSPDCHGPGMPCACNRGRVPDTGQVIPDVTHVVGRTVH